MKWLTIGGALFGSMMVSAGTAMLFFLRGNGHVQSKGNGNPGCDPERIDTRCHEYVTMAMLMCSRMAVTPVSHPFGGTFTMVASLSRPT